MGGNVKNYNYWVDWISDKSQSFLRNVIAQIAGIPSGVKISQESITWGIFSHSLNTADRVILLLSVALSKFDDSILLEKWIIDMPKGSDIFVIRTKEWGDLFHEYVITPKIFCLHLAYHEIRGKLFERNTPLFRMLLICICLELWRLRVPSEIILWDDGLSDIDWGWLVASMTNNFSHNTTLNFSMAGYWNVIERLRAIFKANATKRVPENKVILELYRQIWIVIFVDTPNLVASSVSSIITANHWEK